jgi:hypothetical protein
VIDWLRLYIVYNQQYMAEVVVSEPILPFNDKGHKGEFARTSLHSLVVINCPPIDERNTWNGNVMVRPKFFMKWRHLVFWRWI